MEVVPDWAPMSVPTANQLLGVWGRSAEEAYAVGWNGTVLRWDGQSWVQEATSTTQPLTEVSGAPANPADPLASGPVFAVGWGGTLLERAEDGTWLEAPRSSTLAVDLFGVHLSDLDTGLAVGDAGTVLEWNGTEWTDVDFAVTSEFSGELVRPRTTLSGVWSRDGDRWIITGAGGASFRSSGGTTRFETLDTRESIPLRGVWGTGNETWTVGLEGVVLQLTNRWRREGNDVLPDAFLFGVWGRDASDLTVVGWGGTIVRRATNTWWVENAGSEVDLRDVWVDAATGLALAVGARGTILTRTSSVTL